MKRFIISVDYGRLLFSKNAFEIICRFLRAFGFGGFQHSDAFVVFPDISSYTPRAVFIGQTVVKSY